MALPLIANRLISMIAIPGWLLLAAMSMPPSAHGASPDDGLMTEAIRYLGVVRGGEIAADDADWLKRQWVDEATLTPKAVQTDVDALAFSFERHQRAPDLLALANARTALVKNVYCTAEQSGDPLQQRLSDILAPPAVVLAADCLLGLVVTRFDVDGLVASHALTAEVMGRDFEADADRQEIVGIIEAGFRDADPSEKALIAGGELRHAILDRFWSRIGGGPGQRAVVDEIRAGAAADLRGTARQLETLAASRLSDVDYLAAIGDARLTAGDVDSYRQWLERLAGHSFSVRDRAWLQQSIVTEFKADPGKTLGETAGIREMNSAYIRADSAAGKADLVAGWAADMHCYLSASSDPDEIRLAEVIFREDPVVDADCQARRLRRKSDDVLAEAGGRQLTEKDLEPGIRFAGILLGRPLLPEEAAVVRTEAVQSFDQKLDEWNQEQEVYRAFLGKIDQRTDSHFLSIAERKELFDPIYCNLKSSDDPFAGDYLAMFRRGETIVFEDCDEQLVTTRDEIDATIGFVNFLRLLNDRPPLSEADVETLRQSLTSQNLNKAEVSMRALDEWWSLPTLEEKTAEIANARAQGITPEADGDTIANFLNRVKLEVVTRNAALKACRVAAIVAEGQTAIFAAKVGRYHWNDRDSRITGFPGREHATLVANTNASAELCKGLLGGG